MRVRMNVPRSSRRRETQSQSRCCACPRPGRPPARSRRRRCLPEEVEMISRAPDLDLEERTHRVRYSVRRAPRSTC